MLQVQKSRIGAVAFARMARDQVLHPYASGRALAPGMPTNERLRAWSLLDVVPPGTVLSGSAGLWVHGYASAITQVDVVGLRGRHRVATTDPEGLRIECHSGGTAQVPSTRICGVDVATAAWCAFHALRWEAAESCLPPVMMALREVAALEAEVSALVAHQRKGADPQGRVRKLWQTITAARSGRNYEGFREPVMRRAS